jgi:hypothetical protein
VQIYYMLKWFYFYTIFFLKWATVFSVDVLHRGEWFEHTHGEFLLQRKCPNRFLSILFCSAKKSVFYPEELVSNYIFTPVAVVQSYRLRPRVKI